jgi:broad specificity phosphatase PhoE
MRPPLLSTMMMMTIPLPLITTTDGTVDNNWSTASSGKPPPAIPAVQVVTSMPPPLPAKLHNTYLLLRHGLSTANVDAIISSNRYDLAYTDIHGLTETGYEQGRQAAQHVLEQVMSLSLSNDNDPQQHLSIVFVSSPFARARQTATACREGLRQQLLLQQQPSSSSPIIMDESIYIHPGLMERSFGRLDGEAIETYAYVWPLDRFNVTHTAFDVESVAAVCHRFRQCILDLEEAFPPSSSSSRTIIVLTSHADVLQIAQLYAANVPNVGGFSSYRFKSKFVVVGWFVFVFVFVFARGVVKCPLTFLLHTKLFFFLHCVQTERFGKWCSMIHRLCPIRRHWKSQTDRPSKVDG